MDKDEEVQVVDLKSPVIHCETEKGPYTYLLSNINMQNSSSFGEKLSAVNRKMNAKALETVRPPYHFFQQLDQARPKACGPSDTPLGCNPEGSLLELAYKLKLADMYYRRDGTACHSNGSGDERPKQALTDGEEEARPVTNGKVVNGVSEPHANDAHEDCASESPVAAPADAEQQQATEEASTGIFSSQAFQYLQEIDGGEPYQLPESNGTTPSAATPLSTPCGRPGKKLKLDWDLLLRTKISLLGEVSGGIPSLWNILTATKEIRSINYPKILKEFQDRVNNDSEKCSSQPEKNPTEGEVASLEPASDTVSAGELAEGNADTTAKGDQNEIADTDNIGDMFSFMYRPISDAESAIISEQAVNVALKAKTPARFLSHALASKATPMGMMSAGGALLTLSATCSDAEDSMPLRQDLDGSREGLRKYPCPHCPYQTDNRSHFRRHLSSVHAIGMPYHCYMCSRDFPRSEKVKAHFTKCHPYVSYDPLLVRKEKYFGTSGAGMYSNDTSPQKVPTRARSLSPNSRTNRAEYDEEFASAKMIKFENDTQESEMDEEEHQRQLQLQRQTLLQQRATELANYTRTTPLVDANSFHTSSSDPCFVRLPDEANGSLTVSASGPAAELDPLRPTWNSPSPQEVRKRYYCPECPYTGKDIWHLKRHVNDVHSQTKELKCPMCPYSTSRKHRLVSHMKNHGELYCFHCDSYRTSSMEEFQVHIKACRPASQRVASHECPTCDYKCMNRKQLQDHMFKQHGVILFCCDKCMFYSSDIEAYDKHLLQHLEHMPAEGTCHMCSKIFSDGDALREHIRAAHAGIGPEPQPQPQPQPPAPVQSPACSASSMMLGLGPKAPPSAPLSCTMCNFRTLYPNVMNSHQQLHNGLVLHCDTPGCRFVTAKGAQEMDNHRRLAHREPPVRREPPTHREQQPVTPTSQAGVMTTPVSTGQGSGSNSTVTSPAGSSRSGGPKPQGKGTFVCPVCKDSRPPFRYKKSFDKHMGQHEQDAEPCPLCGQIFYIRASLKQHLQHDHQANVVEASCSSSSSDDSSDDDQLT